MDKEIPDQQPPTISDLIFASKFKSTLLFHERGQKRSSPGQSKRVEAKTEESANRISVEKLFLDNTEKEMQKKDSFQGRPSIRDSRKHVIKVDIESSKHKNLKKTQHINRIKEIYNNEIQYVRNESNLLDDDGTDDAARSHRQSKG